MFTDILSKLMGLETIPPGGLAEMISKGRLTVFDVNTRQSWANAHVPGAVNLDPKRFSAGELPTDKSALLVFYCSGPLCRKAPRAALRAKKMGFTAVKVMPAGISGWISAGLPTDSG